MVEGIELTSDEKNVFDLEFDRFLTTHFRERELVDIVSDHRDYLLGSAQIAKEKFTGNSFGGVHAGSSEYGWTYIRPEWLGNAPTSGSLPTAASNWAIVIAATGWADWIASAATPVKLNKDALIVIMGYQNFAPAPKASAVKATVGGQVTYPVQYLEYALRSGNISLYELAKPYRVLPEQTYNTRVKYSSLGTDELALFGVGFAKGTYLVTETPAVGT